MPVDFDSLGTYLRQERERQQVSLPAIAAATKIQLKFLDALEHDAYDQLPAPPFVVGFLRAYAQHIAIDPEMVLTAYRSLRRASETPEVVRRPVTIGNVRGTRLVLNGQEIPLQAGRGNVQRDLLLTRALLH